MRVIINSLLVGSLVSLLVLPIIVAQQLISFQVAPGGLVAGIRTIDERVVNVIPNTTDFNEYVSFNPGVIYDGKYTDTISLTSFQRQKETYRGIYSIYNLSIDQYIQTQITSTGIVPTDDTFERAIIWIGAEPYKLKRELTSGTTIIEGLEKGAFNEKEQIVIGDEEVTIVAVSDFTVVVTPLRRSHSIGELVYPQAIIVTPGKLVYPQTNQITINPNDRVSVYIEVMGTASLIKRDQKIGIPLEFRFSYAQ